MVGQCLLFYTAYIEISANKTLSAGGGTKLVDAGPNWCDGPTYENSIHTQN